MPSAIAIAASPVAESALEPLASTLREGGWRGEVVVARSASEVPPPDQLAACVLLHARDTYDAELLARVEELGRHVPLIVLGDEISGAVSCCLPAVPPARTLVKLLETCVATGPVSRWSMLPFREGGPSSKPRPRSCRRRSDMVVGDSEATRRLLHELDRLKGSSQLVLIGGESGTGKELVARALHYSGPRADEPFVTRNCAAIPEPLVEAELFGCQRGAFTGAVTNRGGAFEAAQSGTLFLDEIGEISRSVQAKLLRVLETHQVVRLGSVEPRPVRARIVAATSRNLEEEVRAGRFREDLFYRLHVFPVQIAPLRDRPEDIPPIVAHHLSLFAEREKRPIPVLTGGALEKLLTHTWPGNVRELVHVLTRAILFAPTNTIEAEHITVCDAGVHRALAPYRDAKHSFESEYYGTLMRVAGGNVTLAARLADKTRKEIYDALKRLGLDSVNYRARARAKARSRLARRPPEEGDGASL